MSEKSEPGPDEPASDQGQSSAEPTPNPLLKLAIELGPLVVFFLVNAKFDIYAATPAFMVAITAALIASRRLEKRWPVMPLVTAVFVLVFGGLTIYLQDALFILIKATIVNLLFASVLLGALVVKRPLLRELLGSQIDLEQEGWFKLTRNYGFFFLALAGINELIWRNIADPVHDYATWKLWVIFPLTLVFSATQIPIMQRYMRSSEDEDSEDSPESPSGPA